MIDDKKLRPTGPNFTPPWLGLPLLFPLCLFVTPATFPLFLNLSVLSIIFLFAIAPPLSLPSSLSLRLFLVKPVVEINSSNRTLCTGPS